MIINFSLVDSLVKLKNKNYDININNTIDLLTERFGENELRLLSQQGLKIDNNIIRLYFMDGVGFRCFNEKSEIIGKIPLCRNIEEFMNKIYLEHISKLSSGS